MTEKRTFVAGFDADVFISYARLDDKPIVGDEDGWVSQLYNELVGHLPEYLGGDAIVWRDREDIRNNEDFAIKIAGQLGKTATFIAILSESFFNREWCLREVRTFSEHATKNVGILVDGTRKRIFKVEKMPVDRDTLPAELQGTTAYKFFGDGARILRPTIKEYRDQYVMQVEDLLKDLATVLKVMARQAQSGEQAAPEPAAMTVYVAETTSDLDNEAAEIRRDLKERGFRVLPAGDLMRRAGPFRDEVSAGLAQSVLSVHLIGQDYGFVPEGETQKSNVWLQHELAMERGRADSNFARVIWIQGDAPSDARQRNFVDYLDQDAGSQEGAELLRNCGLEEVKTELYDQLQKIRARQESEQAQRARTQRGNPDANGNPAANGSPPASPEEPEPPLVYVVCDAGDRRSPVLNELRKYLLRQGFEPVLPDDIEDHVPGEAASGKSAVEEHIDNLKSCDACLIFYGQASPKWFNQKLADLRKYLRGRQKPVLAKAVYDSPADGGGDRDVETNEAMVLRGGKVFSPEPLAPFLERLRQSIRRA
jgi:hypothetical protein